MYANFIALLYFAAFGAALAQNTTVTTPTPTTSSETPTETPTTPIPTTPKPAPKGPPIIEYTKNNTDGTFCIIVNVSLHIDVEYKTKANKSKVFAFDVTAPTHGQEECTINGSTQFIEIGADNDTGHNYVLKVTFSKEMDRKNQIGVSAIQLLYRLDAKDAQQSGDMLMARVANQKMFITNQQHSYLCNSKTDVSLDPFAHVKTNLTGGRAIVSFSNLRMQAFAHSDKKVFAEAEQCPADEVINDIVPIVVGAALGGLVLIVLVAYLIGRRRSQQRGYQTV